MKIALVQMSSKKNNLKSNLAVTADFVKRAAQNMAEIVVFPEMNLTAYFTSEVDASSALAVEDKNIQEIIKLSKAYNLTIIFGIAEKKDSKLYISQLVAQHGELMGVYRKHNVVGAELKLFTPGKDLPIFNLGKLKFGITICADIDVPELFAEYAKAGCQLIFECASPDLYGDRDKRDWEKGYAWWRENCLKKIGQYAQDNKIVIAVATQSGRNQDDDFPGGGYLFLPTGQLSAETINYQQEILLVDI